MYGHVPRHQKKIEKELIKSDYNFDKVTRTKTIIFSERDLKNFEDEPLDIDSALLNIGSQRVSMFSNYSDKKSNSLYSPNVEKDKIVSDQRGGSAFYHDL